MTADGELLILCTCWSADVDEMDGGALMESPLAKLAKRKAGECCGS